VAAEDEETGCARTPNPAILPAPAGAGRIGPRPRPPRRHFWGAGELPVMVQGCTAPALTLTLYQNTAGVTIMGLRTIPATLGGVDR
jgi:hypothetical protein